jgi:hypothetical protein
MREFFHGRRRKLGTATLLIALLFVGGWIRSFVVNDYIIIPRGVEIGDRFLGALGTEDQSLVLYGHRMPIVIEPEPDPEEIRQASCGSTISATEPARQESEPADALLVSTGSEDATDELIFLEGTSIRFPIISGWGSGHGPVVKIPFSWIVMPLTLLSVYLLLWNPRKPVSTPL